MEVKNKGKIVINCPLFGPYWGLGGKYIMFCNLNIYFSILFVTLFSNPDISEPNYSFFCLLVIYRRGEACFAIIVSQMFRAQYNLYSDYSLSKLVYHCIIFLIVKSSHNSKLYFYYKSSEEVND